MEKEMLLEVREKKKRGLGLCGVNVDGTVTCANKETL